MLKSDFMPAFELIMHFHKDATLMQFQVHHVYLFYIVFYMLYYETLPKQKLWGCCWPLSPGLGTKSFGLGLADLRLDCVCLI